MINKKIYLVNLGIFIVFLVAMILADNFPVAASTFPILICRVGISLTVLLTIKMLVKDAIIKKNAKKLQDVRDEIEKAKLTKEHYKSIFIFMSMLLVYIFSINRLGYFVSTIIYSILSMSVFKKKINWVIIVVAVVFSMLMYLIFDRFLHLMIPHGILY